MKKRNRILFLILFILILTSLLYFFIPNSVKISENVSFEANQRGLFRALSDTDTWKNWWPGATAIDPDNHRPVFYLHGLRYEVTERQTSTMILSVRDSADQKPLAKSSLNIFPLGVDSVRVECAAVYITSYQPFARVKRYLGARSFENDLALLLRHLQANYSQTRNIYGIDVHQELVNDSTLASTFTIADQYPDTRVVYQLLDQLKIHISREGASITGIPMLNVTTEDSAQYLVRVAIPVDKKVSPFGNIRYKWMMGGGKILVADIKGGSHTISQAFSSMKNYADDHQRIMMAIPFQSLVTDRRQEPDTSKWMTRIFYPVM